MNKNVCVQQRNHQCLKKRLFLGYVSSRWVLHQSVLQQLFLISGTSQLVQAEEVATSLYGNNSSS